jgi:hypothetical protein
MKQWVSAYRLAWMLRHGAWPSGVIMHRCDNGFCVNPDHLEEGDQHRNMRDARTRGRTLGQNCMTMVRTDDGWVWEAPRIAIEVGRTDRAILLVIV